MMRFVFYAILCVVYKCPPTSEYVQLHAQLGIATSFEAKMVGVESWETYCMESFGERWNVSFINMTFGGGDIKREIVSSRSFTFTISSNRNGLQVPLPLSLSQPVTGCVDLDLVP